MASAANIESISSFITIFDFKISLFESRNTIPKQDLLSLLLNATSKFILKTDESNGHHLSLARLLIAIYSSRSKFPIKYKQRFNTNHWVYTPEHR
ncbi:hypothetical protein ES288_D05G324000v1 [Gossypium darwinii]|nr:hypothetical protein ES288_D05G324000v1 [Gossypium darwinii]